jgi:RHS repeat-associated protein
MTNSTVCATTASFPRSHFTGKERDAESGNDYFGARYYASSMGRFMSPDPKQITKPRMFDPQQWNMYSYTRNNPMVAVDPDGKELRFVNKEQATKAVAAFQMAVQPSQRSAISWGMKDDHFVLQVDKSVADAAGLRSNLGRLGVVANDERVANFQYIDPNTKFSEKVDGKTYTGETLLHASAGGITLLPDNGTQSKGEPTNTSTTETQIYADGSEDPSSTSLFSIHEVDVHLFRFFQTGDDAASGHGDPETDKTTREVQYEWEVIQNPTPPKPH